MKWDETVASKCRYGEVAERIFKDADILWEDSEANYQGHVNVLAKMPDGRFVHYEYAYGSCSGCDEWENITIAGVELYTDEWEEKYAATIEEVMRSEMIWFENEMGLRNYLNNIDRERNTYEEDEDIISMNKAYLNWKIKQA